MEHSEDIPNIDEMHISAEPEQMSSVDTDADAGNSRMSADGERAERIENNGGNTTSTGISELVGIAIKTIAVTVALVLLITSILAVGLPFQAMRIYNKLGMIERAVDFGERYITRELKSYDAYDPDAAGNYVTLRSTEELTNDDFIEALYVCINNSYKLMNGSYRSGDEKTGEYYATRVEKYSRMYLSLNGVSGVNSSRSRNDVAAMPLYEMRPLVYDYGHTIISMNYRARAYLGTTDTMLFNSNGGDVVTTLGERTETLYGIEIGGDRNALIANMDWYVDYIDALGEYLDVEFLLAGVENDMSAKYNRNGVEMPIWTETAVRELYTGKLDGNGFSLIVDRTDGFGNVYKNLVNGGAKNRFADYVEQAINFTPSDNNNNKLDEMLHQLYWLQALRSTAIKLTYLNYLLYFNSDSYGSAAFAINNAQFELRDSVAVDKLTRAYTDKLNEYKSLYQSV